MTASFLVKVEAILFCILDARCKLDVKFYFIYKKHSYLVSNGNVEEKLNKGLKDGHCVLNFGHYSDKDGAFRLWKEILNSF